MNAEKIILYPLIVNKQGAITSFQIKIPSDVKRINGIETSIRGLENIGQFTWDPPMYDFLRARAIMTAGYLSLQCAEVQGAFFNQPVRLHDHSYFQGDFSQSAKLRAFQWIKGAKREATPIMMHGDLPPVIFGTYYDRYDKLWEQDITYTVNIYLWCSI